MTDLTKRLRALSRHEHDDLSIGDEAADEIKRLQSGLARHVDRVCTLTAERDALRARIEDAPILDGYQAAIIHMGGRTINVVSADLVGKRVALVVLEDGK
jgi:hypothetical protein